MLRKHPELLIVGTVIIATLVYFVYYELSLPRDTMDEGLHGGELTSAQSKSIDAMLDVSHLMIAWAVAIIGASALLVRLIFEKYISAFRVDFFILFASVITAVFSLYFAHLGIYFSAEMLAAEQFPIGDKIVMELFSRQYISILISTGLFGILVVLLFWRSLENGSRKSI